MAKTSFSALRGTQPAAQAAAPAEPAAAPPAPKTTRTRRATKPAAVPAEPVKATDAGGGFKRARKVEDATPSQAPRRIEPAEEEAPPVEVEATVTPDNTQNVETDEQADAAAAELKAAEAQQEQAMVQANQNRALAPRGAFNGIFEDVAGIDFKDLLLPRINLVQKSGQLADIFTPGDICFQREVALPQPLQFLLLGFRPTSFVEKVDEGEEGTVYATEPEVVANGGTTEWTDHNATGKPLFQRLTTALILLKAPENTPDDLLDMFPYELGGSNWALAAWSMKGPSYTAVVKPLKTARKFGYLRDGYHASLHSLESKQKTYKTGRTGYVPIVKSAGRCSDEFIEEVANLLQAFSSDEE